MVKFGILGPIELINEERPVSVGGPRQLALLAFLLVHANRAVSADHLIEALWGDQDPAGAVKRLQVAIARLRKALGSSRAGGESSLRSAAGGYLLVVGPGELDADVFEARAQDGCRALEDSEPASAAELLRGALALWRGPPLAEVAYESFAQDEIRRLEELRLAALEARVEADLRLGGHAALVGELQSLAAAHPARERLAGQLMVALYRCGRQAEALDVYQRTRAHLAAELGLDPGPTLRALQAQILEQSPALQPLIDDAGASVSVDRLPVPPTPTIGRDREAAEISVLLQRAEVRLVTLTGPGGVGKTRLALRVAHQVSSQFRDGSCWVELASVADAGDVESTVARALGVTPLRGESMTNGVCRYLARKRLLMVIDNFEHVLESAVVVAHLLDACPGLTVLATSREALNLTAEHRVAVVPLLAPARPQAATLVEIETTDATALFIAAAWRHDSRFAVTAASAPAIARICATLDGLPLALELAAASTGLLSVEELAARIDGAVESVGSGRRNAPARQQTLRATIDWSYNLLDAAQQDAFIRFAVFAGGATLDAAQVITAATTDTFEALIAKSLLEHRHQANRATRLLMLETIRQYALQRLAQDREQEVLRQRHLEHYLHLVEHTVPRLSTHHEREALAVLDGEIDNLRAALQWALDAAPPDALRLAGHLGEYWLIRHDLDGLRWLDAALDAAGGCAPLQDRARARMYHCMQFAIRDDIPAATRDAETALELYREAGDHAGIACALCELAVGAGIGAGDLEKEQRLAKAACRHAQVAGDERSLGRALARLAAVSGEERHPLLEQAAELLSRVGDFREIAVAYSNAAYIVLTEDHVAEAASLLDIALDAVQKVDSPYWTMIIQGNVGLTKLFAGHLVDARTAFERSLQLCVEHTFTNNGEALAGMAAIATREGHYDAAARLRGAARAAGYPPAILDQRIDDRLQRDFYAPAHERYGLAQWSRDEEAGAALLPDEAVAYALKQSSQARQHQRRRKPHLPPV